MTSIVVTCSSRNGPICKIYKEHEGKTFKKYIKILLEQNFDKRLIEYLIPLITRPVDTDDVYIYSATSDIKGDIEISLVHTGQQIILKE